MTTLKNKVIRSEINRDTYKNYTFKREMRDNYWNIVFFIVLPAVLASFNIVIVQ